MEPFELQERYYVDPEPSPAVTFWQRNKPSILVASSQLFGALMNMSARLLELGEERMHPLQVLLVRQSLTVAACSAYMYWTSTPGFPWGPKGIRILLGLRGFFGFFGIFCMWSSMMYLPLADATVITFLAPGITGLACFLLLGEPFTRIERIATLVALFGVVLIAQPASLFSTGEADSPTSAAEVTTGPEDPSDGDEATPEERLMAVGIALLGVCGAAGAYTMLRTIGKRAHPLISVNAFGMTCVLICSVGLVICPLFDIGQPEIRWVTPSSLWQWSLLLLLGIFGFVMQYLLTAGLSADRTNKANTMIYTHMLFAAGIDRWVFHHEPSLMSFLGCVLILGSAISVVILKSRASAPPPVASASDIERQEGVADRRDDYVTIEGEERDSDEMPLHGSR